MKVGGVDLDTQFTHSLSLGLTIVTLTIWMCISFSTAVLLLTAFCFGAGLLSIILDLGHGHQLPNFLSHLKRPTLHKKLKKKPNVSKEEDANIPIEVDEALEQFYERVLQEYIYPWYSLLSYDEDFVQEIRFIFRHATLELWKRLSKVDLTALITRKAIPIGLNHLDALLRSAEYKRQYGHADDPDLHKFLHEYLGPSAHPAALSRLKEVEYCRAIAANLVPFLMPKRYLSSRSVVLLVTDVLQGAILQPVLDLLPDPDHCVNFLIAVAFDPDPSRKFPPPSGKNVRLLENFVSAHQESRQSALKLDLSAILKNQSSLFSFMKFLKEENSLNQLQFCLSVEDFNKRIMTPELNEDEMRLLHKEAMELYDLYFKPNAKHKIDVSQHLAQEIYAILDGPISDVVLLRTTTPLFQAYDEVFGQLESKACPAFHKSEEYFNDLLGCRETDGPDGVDKLNARSKFDAGAKPSEKIGKGLSKLKHEVLGKSIEGIVDHTVMDSAFDIVDIYDDQSDVTLVSSQRGSGPFSDYRDLSAWRISIPRLATSCYPQNGKPCFVFVVNVQRIDITAQQEDGEDLHWTVHRRYSEFYALEAKLTEFHGEFEDVRLPPKAKFWKGLDVLQGKKQAFEDYLVGLLQKPSLRESDILYTFLTSKEEFTLDGSNLGLGKMIKNVPIKLTKERGQSLQTFIDNFLLQIQSPPPKPRYDSVIGAVAEHDGTTERLVEPHHVFKNNFARQEITVQSRSLAQFFSDRTVYRIASVYDTIVYLLANIFYVTRPTLQLIMGIGALIRQSFDWLVDYAIDTKLTQVLSCMRIAYLCRLLQGALFDSKEKLTESEFAARRERALGNFQTFLRPFVQFVTGQNKFENGTQFVFEALQDPVANKHLALVLIDAVVAEVFPELEL